MVRRAFRARGHKAFSCDIEPSDDKSPFHIEGDLLDVMHDHRWDMMIAHPQDDIIAERLRGLPALHVLDSGVPLLEQLGNIGGPHNVVVKTICSNAGLEAKLAGYTVEADSAWYKDMSRWQAFFTACDGQFNCDELREFGRGLVEGLINLNK